MVKNNSWGNARMQTSHPPSSTFSRSRKHEGKVSIGGKDNNCGTASNIQREIKVKGKNLETLAAVRYLGANVLHDGSKPEVLSRGYA